EDHQPSRPHDVAEYFLPGDHFRHVTSPPSSARTIPSPSDHHPHGGQRGAGQPMSRPRRRKPTKASSFTRTCSIPREHLGLALSSPLESIALVSTRITEKGQVTVPTEVRGSLGPR